MQLYYLSQQHLCLVSASFKIEFMIRLGLTIGLLSLDCNTLHILKHSGTEKQRFYAAKVEPVRRKGHLLLCSLLIANMLANEAMPIVLNEIFSGGWKAVIVSTVLVVLFGEIIPQAICARYGLAVGAYTVWLVKIIMFIFYPIAWPIAKILSFLLGEHEGVIYRRAELKELVSLHGRQQLGELDPEEVGIIKSVLDLKSKTVATIMRPLDEVFMLDIDCVLDSSVLEAISMSGYSRVPLFEKKRKHIVGVLLVKLLTRFENKQDKTIRELAEHLCIPYLLVESDTPLFELFNRFRIGKFTDLFVFEKY